MSIKAITTFSSENQLGEVEKEVILADMSRVVLLFNSGSGFYIALFFSAPELTKVVTQDYGIYTLAPSLIEHVHNFREGVTKKSYPVDGEKIK